MSRLIFAALLLALASCHKPEPPVPDSPVVPCYGEIEFELDSVKENYKDFSNVLFFEESSATTKSAARLDIRFIDKKGKRYIYTLRDFRQSFVISTGNYRLFDTLGACSVRYLNSNYTPSSYYCDSAWFYINEFNRDSKTLYGSYAFRLVDSTAKDTLRVRNGLLTQVCFEILE